MDDALDEDEDSLYSKKKPGNHGNHGSSEETKKEEESKSSGGGLFSRIFKRAAGPSRMILPDDSKPTIYWDEKLGERLTTL